MNTTNETFTANLFSDTERRAIVTLAIRLFCADSKIASAELAARDKVYHALGITYDCEKDIPKFAQACEIYRSMAQDKRDMVKNTLLQLAAADGHCCEKEQSFINDLDK